LAGRLIHRKRASAGYTLIELLVVLAIVALVASVAVLNAPPPPNDARREADRFAARLQAASQQAIMTGAVIGLDVSAQDYRFYIYNRGAWTLADDARLAPGRFPADVSIMVEVSGQTESNETESNEQGGVEREGDDDTPAPVIFFTPTGETTPLHLRFSARRRFWTLDLNSSGKVSVARDDTQ